MTINLKSFKNPLFLIILLTLFCIFQTKVVYAKGATTSNTNAQFSITPQFTNGQTNLRLGYYHMQVKKGGSYRLRVRIFNHNQYSSVYFQAQLRNAATTTQGQINYAASQHLHHIPRNYKPLPILSINGTKKRILVQAHSYKNVVFKLKVPTAGFRGTVVGGIYVTRQNTPTGTAQTKDYDEINNIFSMTLPVFLSQNFNSKYSPKLVLSKISSTSRNSRHAVLSVKVLNTSPVVFGAMRLNIKLLSQKKVLYKKKLTNLQMAPYSKLPLSLRLLNTPKLKGTYSLTVVIHSGNFNKKIIQKFKIDAHGIVH
ncbi:hypothetical protein FC19_GL001214 [Liquorilactobacillus aquaticus DSM 21051]|uniref:Uncharacterized protein n=1 Tax=Liquorilactobacillus aquaticus DSM 21051 TaxID=1423725 RepID=A0A0R2CWB6_9LACO|nr:hypothetical protein FC19_GL001214 [Liquorilactobacillus aquaticus DSM 21051]